MAATPTTVAFDRKPHNNFTKYQKLDYQTMDKQDPLYDPEAYRAYRGQDNDEDETEDEEVKMHCIGGVRGLNDSDFSSDGESGEDEDPPSPKVEQDPGQDASKRDGVVTFFQGGIDQTTTLGSILRPIPERLSVDRDDDGDSSEASSVSSTPSMGARGIAISFGDSNDDDSSVDTDSEVASERRQGAAGAVSDREQVDANLSDDAGDENGDGKSTQEDASDEAEDDDADADDSSSETDETNHVKRVLSVTALLIQESEPGRASLALKRIKTSDEDITSPFGQEISPDYGYYGPEFNEAPRFPQDRYSTGDSSGDEDLDRALSDELKKVSTPRGDSSPIPLLTPPASPQPSEKRERDGVEWPSNLVVDSAMMKVATLTRPLSLMSLREEDDDDDIHPATDDTREVDASALTPLMRSISVGYDKAKE